MPSDNAQLLNALAPYVDVEQADVEPPSTEVTLASDAAANAFSAVVDKLAGALEVRELSAAIAWDAGMADYELLIPLFNKHKDRLMSARASGMSLKKIAASLRVPVVAVSKWFREPDNIHTLAAVIDVLVDDLYVRADALLVSHKDGSSREAAMILGEIAQHRRQWANLLRQSVKDAQGGAANAVDAGFYLQIHSDGNTQVNMIEKENEHE